MHLKNIKLLSLLGLFYSSISFSTPLVLQTAPTPQPEIATHCVIYIDGIKSISPLVNGACNYKIPKLLVGNHRVNAAFGYYLDGALQESPLSNTIFISRFTSKPDTIYFFGKGLLCNTTNVCNPIE
jgi:hypothetical protein